MRTNASEFTLDEWSGLIMGQKTHVMVLGTIHQYHKYNPHYSYEDIFSLVDRFQADVVGVEIRPEDMDQPLDYLSRNYPYEMIEPIGRYGKEKIVVGFDWLGHELRGRLIPEGYWQSATIKRLEREFEESSLPPAASGLMAICDEERLEIIRSQPSAHELNDGRYDLASRVYYQQLGTVVRGTAFEALSRFYDERDARIAENVLRIVEAHCGKRLAILIGCDHRARTVIMLRERYAHAIELVAIPSL